MALSVNEVSVMENKVIYRYSINEHLISIGSFVKLLAKYTLVMPMINKLTRMAILYCPCELILGPIHEVSRNCFLKNDCLDDTKNTAAVSNMRKTKRHSSIDSVKAYDSISRVSLYSRSSNTTIE